MNKAELVEKVALKAKVSKAAAAEAIAAFQEAVATSVKKGEAVTIVGFGTFALKKRPARNGRNPATGEPMKIKAKRVMSFKTSSALNKSL